MIRSSSFAVALVLAALGLATAPAARADTCYETATVNIDCSLKESPANQSGATTAPASDPNSLREQLRRSLQSGSSPAQSQAISDAEQRWAEAQASAQDATYRAQQTDDPALKAQLKQQYDTAMRDLHQAGADLIKADPQQKARIQALLKNYEAGGARAAAAAGLETLPKAAAAPQPPPAPNNVAQIGADTYVCDGPVAGDNNVSCRQISADGEQCTNVTLADGDVGWQDSIATPCRASDLAQRKAFLARDPDAAAAVANAGAAFTMDPGETQREIGRIQGNGIPGALDSLPPQCRADFEKFLAAGEAKSQANAAQAAASYTKLDKNPQCRDAIKRIASALGVGLPHRKIGDDQRNDWNAALAGPQRADIADVPEIDVSGIPDTGFDPGDSLDSAIDMLNALSGSLRALPSSPSYRPAPAYRAPAPSYPRATSCNSYGCTLSNGAGGNSGSPSTITGGTGQ